MDIEFKRPQQRIGDQRLKSRLTKIETPSFQTKTKKKFGLIKYLVMVIVMLMLIIIAIIYLLSGSTHNGLGKNKSDWQAIFLTNGQTYFGKVVSEDSGVVIIKNIYYLQIPRDIQHSKEKISGDVAIIKLGNEIHGPMDEMRINREHILFVEDMQDNSRVVQAIKNHLESQ